MGLTDSGVDGGGAFSLSSSSSNTMGFSESGPKSRVHWIPSFETEKIVILSLS